MNRALTMHETKFSGRSINVRFSHGDNKNMKSAWAVAAAAAAAGGGGGSVPADGGSIVVRNAICVSATFLLSI